MKWPTSLMLIRHGQSEYNILRAKKQRDPLYQLFQKWYKEGRTDEEMLALAREVKEKFSLGVGDEKTPLTAEGVQQAITTGKALHEEGAPPPDVILYSPYLRTRQTLDGLCDGWPALDQVPQVEDIRIREQEHGLSVIYSDWRVFNTFHPEYRELRELHGSYWYQHPGGESVPNVRDRVHSMMSTLTREYQEQRVLLVTHHLTILSIRAQLERLTSEEFIRLDDKEKPVNCGVTTYTGDPEQGKNGKLILTSYNRKLY